MKQDVMVSATIKLSSCRFVYKYTTKGWTVANIYYENFEAGSTNLLGEMFTVLKQVVNFLENIHSCQKPMTYCIQLTNKNINYVWQSTIFIKYLLFTWNILPLPE